MLLQLKGEVIIPAKGQKSGHYISCEYCGKIVYKTQSQYNKAVHHFCSNKCQKEQLHNDTHEDRKCKICNRTFHTPKRSTQFLCSTECQKIWQTKQIGVLNPKFTSQIIQCEWCGKDFYIKPYRLSDGMHKFCSMACKREWYAQVCSQAEEWRLQSRLRAVNMLEQHLLSTNTKPQIIVNDILDAMNIEYVNEYNCKYYSIDNYLTKQGLMIEVMGDFWHAHPMKYRYESLYEVQKKRIPKDRAKHTYISRHYGVEILYIWEADLYQQPDLCTSLIMLYVKNNGVLPNYHSFNYEMQHNQLKLKPKLIIPYQCKCS